jgi:predicted choloylglycine hydrolase
MSLPTRASESSSTLKLQVFSGTHYDMGIQQGKANRELLQRGLEQIPKLEAVKDMKPRMLPTTLFLSLAKRRAVQLLENDIMKYYPEQAKRLRGISEGAGISMKWTYFIQAMEFMVPFFGPSDYSLQACTAMGFSPSRSTTRETVVAKNFDYPNEFATYQLTCESKPDKRYKTLGCTIASLPGMLDGMNEHGLTVTYNLAFTTDTPENHAPLSIALQEMLETCKTTEQAVKFITEAKRGGHDALLLLADSTGNMKAVEITSNHAETREPVNGQIINTNHYQTAEMQKQEIPHNAMVVVRGNRFRLHESSEHRLARARELLQETTEVNEDTIVRILRDHGKENRPSELTICRHHQVSSTLRSVLFHPDRRTVKVLYGNPCQNDYAELRFV